jgi:aspartate aminotransferase, mitochondrial
MFEYVATLLSLGFAAKPPLSALRVSAYLDTIEQGPPDAILGIAQAFRENNRPGKVNLAVGAYRDDAGLPFVLPSVAAAEARLLSRGEKKEYAPIEGLPGFIQLALKFAYGDDCAALKEGRIAAVQTLSGTGACRLAGEFYARFLPKGTAIYVSDPTWGNHINIMQLAGLEVRKYRYLDRATQGFDFEGLLADIEAAPAGSIFLLHACAHNPTGVDPSSEQWRTVSNAILRKGHHVLLDCAYQGFASGDAEADAFAIRLFLDEGHSLLLAQSFATNFGLYGERVGTLSVVCADAASAGRVLSQLKCIVRPMYSSPPIHGALIVNEVLSNAELRRQYYGDCAGLADRIGTMRLRLIEELAAVGSTHDWSHVKNQIGMFAFTGMTAAMCDELTERHAIYLTRDGRISLPGLNSGNLAFVASAIHEVTNGKSIGSAK